MYNTIKFMKGKCTMKKLILAIAILSITTPVFSEEINITPKNTYSGFNNTAARAKYPQLQKTLSASEIVEEQEANSMMGPKSVREMGNITPSNNSNAPMTYSQFPQNYDSSNSMMLMQGGMQNMFMGY